MEKVSIIVPVYNVENYLDQCIESLVMQTYKNIEIVIIDDGSNDNSGTICDEWGKKDNRIKVFHIKNGGQGHARNVGLKEISGSYIMFIDSDDWVDRDWVYQQLITIKRYGADVVYCGYYETFTNIRIPHDSTKNNQMLFLNNEEAIKNLCLRENLDVMLCMGIFTREIWGGVKFSEGEKAEDILPTYKIICKANMVIVKPCIQYHYRMRKSSTTHSGIKSKAPLVASQYLMDFVKMKYPTMFGYVVYDYINALDRVIKWTSAQGGGALELKKEQRIIICNYLEKLLKLPLGRKMKMKYLVMKYFYPLYIAQRKIKKTIIERYRNDNEIRKGFIPYE